MTKAKFIFNHSLIVITKHPVVINFIIATLIMGGLLSEPVTRKQTKQGEGLGLRYGLSSMQGWRPEMEDAHDVKIGLKYGLDDWSYFAVFDGHAGKCASAFASWNLLEFILTDRGFDLIPEKPLFVMNKFELKEEESTNEEAPKTPKKCPDDPKIDTIKQIPEDETSKSSPETEQNQLKPDERKQNEEEELIPGKFNSLSLPEQISMVENAIKSAFLGIDDQMRVDMPKDMSGCTAVCTIISPTHLFIANCGDSRAVLYDGSSPRFATEDHKPINPKERQRIIDAGGTATQRINGTLAVSRALGDFEFKKNWSRGRCQQLVSPEPEVTVIERKPNDEFLILACDGIWDVIDNDDLCRYVKHELMIESDLEKVCSSVLDVCLCKGSRDNMSIILVVFETGPKLSESEIERVKKNDEILLAIADSVQEEHNPLEFTLFLNRLLDELDSQPTLLPPGAGVEAKYNLLRSRFDENLEKQNPNKNE